MPKKNPLDPWGKQSLDDHLHKVCMEAFTLAKNFNLYFNKTDDFYEKIADLERRHLKLQKDATAKLELPRPTSQ